MNNQHQTNDGGTERNGNDDNQLATAVTASEHHRSDNRQLAAVHAAVAGGSEFGVETRSFASSNVVEPATSIQSEHSEYAGSIVGSGQGVSVDYTSVAEVRF